MWVLLVEDEPDLGATIKRALNQSGYIVDWVLSGTDAWDNLENQRTQYTLGIFDIRDQLLDQLWELGSEPLSNGVVAKIRLLRRELAIPEYEDDGDCRSRRRSLKPITVASRCKANSLTLCALS
jgi:DNA-binding response OmpR family regulator